jgi:hypothetical protein
MGRTLVKMTVTTVQLTLVTTKMATMQLTLALTPDQTNSRHDMSDNARAPGLDNDKQQKT